MRVGIMRDPGVLRGGAPYVLVLGVVGARSRPERSGGLDGAGDHAAMRQLDGGSSVPAPLLRHTLSAAGRLLDGWQDRERGSVAEELGEGAE